MYQSTVNNITISTKNLILLSIQVNTSVTTKRHVQNETDVAVFFLWIFYVFGLVRSTLSITETELYFSDGFIMLMISYD